MPLRKRILKQIAAASFSFCAGTALATFPPDVLAEWVEGELENEPEVTPLSVLDTADRAAARLRGAVSALWPHAKGEAESLVQALAREKDSAARIGAAAGLGRILQLASPAERIELVCRWTVSEDTGERTAIARALALPVQVFVADLALSELARDREVEVRAAAAGAIRTHFHEDPRGFARLLNELSDDGEPSVRRSVREVLARVS